MPSTSQSPSRGRWVLAGPAGTWLQPVISSTSSPWRWRYPCAVLDPALVAGLRAFMEKEIDATFTTALAASYIDRLHQGLARATETTCVTEDPGVAEGPPGPINDRTVVRHVSVSGKTAVVTAVVDLTDWQGGVTGTPVPGGGRRVGWATVHNALDATYRLVESTGDSWRVSSFAANFAPGSGP